MGTDVYRLDMERLEAEGVVLRAGLTPTDIMHIRANFPPITPRGKAGSQICAQVPGP